MEKETADVGYRAKSGVSNIELARIGFGIGDEFFEIVGGEVLADDKQFGIFGGQSDRLEILLRIVA
jgi:hypothetical protein